MKLSCCARKLGSSEETTLSASRTVVIAAGRFARQQCGGCLFELRKRGAHVLDRPAQRRARAARVLQQVGRVGEQFGGSGLDGTGAAARPWRVPLRRGAQHDRVQPAQLVDHLHDRARIGGQRGRPVRGGEEQVLHPLRRPAARRRSQRGCVRSRSSSAGSPSHVGDVATQPRRQCARGRRSPPCAPGCASGRATAARSPAATRRRRGPSRRPVRGSTIWDPAGRPAG